jgi:hypothetical protein
MEAFIKRRLLQPKKEDLPAFQILTDKVRNEIAADRPPETDALLEVSGLGPRYGASILAILTRNCARPPHFYSQRCSNRSLRLL